MAGEKQQGGHRYTLSMKSVITPLHTFPTIFISWVCVTWCTVLYPSVSSPALHPWWRGRVLCELTKHREPSERAAPHCVEPFQSGRDASDIKSETPSVSPAAAAAPQRQSCSNTHRYHSQVYTLFSISVWQKDESRSRHHLEQAIDFSFLILICLLFKVRHTCTIGRNVFINLSGFFLHMSQRCKV